VAGELIETEVLETAPVVGKTIKELGLSDGARFSAILPNAPLVAPQGSTEFKHKDHAIRCARGSSVWSSRCCA
jgi:trk system potassium uptake protein TrkA